MNPNSLEKTKREIDDIFTEIPASSIPIKQEVTEEKTQPIDVNEINMKEWSTRSLSILTDYKFGENLAKFGNNELSTKQFFKRFAGAISSIIANEYQKRGMGSESMMIYFNMLNNLFALISRDIDNRDLKDFDIVSVISSLHGFITNYTNQKGNMHETNK